MAVQTLRPIYDTLARIQNFTTYPYKEGQVYFASENNQLFVDIDGQRAAQAQLSSIGVLDGVNEIYEKGVKGFEGQILTAKTSNGYRLFYVDNDAQVHNLTFTAEDLGSITEDGFQGGALQYNGVWATNKTYFADELRTSVVKEGNNFYYATETHTSGTFATDLTAEKWIKFSIQFTSVATSLLLAEDAVITKTLVIGTEGTDIGTIRSTGATALNTGTGFFMSNTSNGVFRIGNPSGNFIRWDGSSLTINAPISIDYANVTGTKPPANADVTSTVIAGGLITTGTLQVSQGGTVAAGITGNTSGDTAVRFFAGSTFENRASAPFRVLQNGNLFASNANISGTINASLGSIGAFNISTVTDPDEGSGYLTTSSAGGIKQAFLSFNQFSIRETISNITYRSQLRPTYTRVSYNPASGNSFAAELLYNGIQTATTDGFSATNFNVKAAADLILSSGSGFFVYARNDGSVGTPSSSFRVTVGTGGVSTKIIKDQINEIDYNSVDEFFNLINIKTYQNLLNNKPNISLIIEDEEEKNVPFKDLLFIKENRLVIYNKEVPTWLEPYKNDTNVITQELDENGDINYVFSPKGLNEHSMRGIMLAGIKSGHNKIKQLESENEELKARLDAIEAKLKD